MKPQDQITIAADKLEFRPISRAISPGVKARMIQCEGVHPFSGYDDVRELDTYRLPPPEGVVGVAGPGALSDKQCFGLFAPGRDIPETIVYMSLQKVKRRASYLEGPIKGKDLPGELETILRQPVSTVEDPDLGVFYSVTNLGLLPDGSVVPGHPVEVVRGEKGESAATVLLTKSYDYLKKHCGITDDTTLSPARSGKEMPADASKGQKATHACGFEQWLEKELQAHDNGERRILTRREEGLLVSLKRKLEACYSLKMEHEAAPKMLHNDANASQPQEVPTSSYEILKAARWEAQHRPVASLKGEIERLMEDLGQYYIVHEKSEIKGSIVPFDKVARVHLGNGAQLANVHWTFRSLNTPSENIGGGGLTMNYRYVDPAARAVNKEAFSRGEVAQDAEMKERYEARLGELKEPLNMVKQMPRGYCGTVGGGAMPYYDRAAAAPTKSR